jgi:uncharacterized protein (TIGR03435 family)
MPIVGFVNTMANILRTPVVDRSGLTGRYSFELDPTQVALADNSTGAARSESWGDLLVEAMRQQIGLRLEKQKTTLEITVIDRAEKPTEN